MKKQFRIPNSAFRIHLVGLLLTLVMMVSLFGIFSLTASAAAANSVSYVDYTWSEESKTLSSETKSVDTYTEITSTTTEMTNGWYVVNGEVTVAERMTAKGEVHLILCDGAQLTVKGIEVGAGKSLTVYGQVDGTGMLNADTANDVMAGIGGGGSITIHGGIITADGGSKCAGIGGNSNTDGGTITIYDGEIIATGGGGAAGIGGGYNASGGTITIYGGDITATGGTDATNYGAGAGIGGGASNATSSNAISGGGTITINGGTVIATGGAGSGMKGSGAGIGGGGGGRNTFAGTCGNVTINGGTVTATAGTANDNSYVGLDIGRGGFSRIEINSGSITINGGNVNASNVSPLPKDADGNSLLLVAITLEGAYDIDGLKMLLDSEGNLIDYRVSNAMLPDGKLYVYLPQASATSVNSLVLGRYEYILNGDWSGDEVEGYSATFMQNGLYNCDHRYNTNFGIYTVHDDAHSFECSVCEDTISEDHSTTADGDKAANCGSKAYCSVCDSEYGYVDKTNHDSSVDFNDNGFCENGCYEPAIDSNSDSYYEISNAGQLFWFANHVNTVDRTASAVLVADIDLENRPWTPIGSTGEQNHNFRGVFDGQNHTIKGLYVEGGRAGLGFFGEVRTGTVKNFTIYGEVIVNTQHDYVGGVIGSICGLNSTDHGLERNGAIIQNITSYVNLTAKAHGVGMIGGFVGYANHQSLIENCSWYGTFDAGIYRVDSGAGGFIGKIQENTSEVTIRNCAAYGTIKTNYEKNSFNNTPTIYMGGFLSFSNTNAQTTLENCLFAGKFERGENLTDEAFLGAFGTLRSVNSIKNCYYLGDGVLEAVHSDSNLKPGSDNVEITSVTGAQLLSGEVAYKLGEHFGQILEGENRQSYPVLGGTKVEDSQRFEIYGQQLSIGVDLSMKYYVMGYAPAFNSGALYMEFSLGGVKTKVYAGEPNADGFYVFVLEGINPQCMGDSIDATLYYGDVQKAVKLGYTVEENLNNLLTKYKDDAALVALINDTLAYGKAASEYKKHDTMTGDYTVSDSTIPDATVTPSGAFTGYTVVFGQVNFIKVRVALETGYTLYLDGTDITSQLVDGIFKTDGITPTNFDKKFSFEIKNGDTVVQTFAVSVNDYIGAQKDSATMGNLVKALYNYGVSAEEYVALQNG